MSVPQRVWATFTAQSSELLGSSLAPSREELNASKSIPQNAEGEKRPTD